jgi:hypothetical protein
MQRAIRRALREAYTNDGGTRLVEAWQQRLAARYMVALLNYVDELEERVDQMEYELTRKNGQ